MGAPDPGEFAGKRVAVTGGTKGTGLAVFRRFAAGGAAAITAARSPCPDAVPQSAFVQADLATAEGCCAFAAAALERLGGIDILVHVLGGSQAPGGGFAASDDAVWQAELELNLLSAVRVDRALLPQMIARGSGAVIHTASIQHRLPLHDATTALPPPRPRSPPTARRFPRKWDPRESA